ncbi:hypothetical protein BD410DRAFT_846243 [Rickenella mellea]|uniref:F-box domain-containing protein n=1 Tax=Rickenella mellea TaxID=50990 RepID=A0A4Y7PFL4_9AGAM|nr:hypothetical protein BD410DRAFT_846243 [Rickenella mellea]
MAYALFWYFSSYLHLDNFQNVLDNTNGHNGTLKDCAIDCLRTGVQYLPSTFTTQTVRRSLKAALLETCETNEEYFDVLRSSVLVSKSFLHLFGDTLLEATGFLLISESNVLSISLKRVEAYLALPLWSLLNRPTRRVSSIECAFSDYSFMEVKLLCDYLTSLPPWRSSPHVDNVTLDIPWTERLWFVDILQSLPVLGAKQLTLRCNGIEGAPPVNTQHFPDENYRNLRILEIDGPAFFDDRCFLPWTRSMMSQTSITQLTLVHTPFDVKRWDDFLVGLWFPSLEVAKLETGMSIGGLAQFLFRHPTLTALYVEAGTQPMVPGEPLKFKLVLPYLDSLHGPFNMLRVLLTALGDGSNTIACLGILPDMPTRGKLRLMGTDVASILAEVPNIRFLRIVFPTNSAAMGFGRTARHTSTAAERRIEKSLWHMESLEIVRPGTTTKRSFIENIVFYIDLFPALRTVKLTESSVPPSNFRAALLGRCPYLADQDIISD